MGGEATLPSERNQSSLDTSKLKLVPRKRIILVQRNSINTAQHNRIIETRCLKENSKVGSCNCFFGACSASTHVTAPARSRNRQATLYTESSDSFVASAAASIATGWSASSRAGVAPAVVQRLSRRTLSPTIQIAIRMTAWARAAI